MDTKKPVAKEKNMGCEMEGILPTANENVTIFLVSGRTYTFKNCHDIVDNENCISFRYTAMSDGNTKKATFYKYNGSVAGVSRCF